MRATRNKGPQPESERGQLHLCGKCLDTSVNQTVDIPVQTGPTPLSCNKGSRQIVRTASCCDFFTTYRLLLFIKTLQS